MAISNGKAVSSLCYNWTRTISVNIYIKLRYQHGHEKFVDLYTFICRSELNRKMKSFSRL